MQAKGLDLSEHRSKAVTENLLNDYELILCMEQGHKRSLQRNFPTSADKIYLLSEMVSADREIEDPIGLSDSMYRSTADKITFYLNEGFENISRLSG